MRNHATARRSHDARMRGGHGGRDAGPGRRVAHHDGRRVLTDRAGRSVRRVREHLLLTGIRWADALMPGDGRGDAPQGSGAWPRADRPGGRGSRPARGVRSDQGTTTAEYAIVTMAAVAFAGTLVAILRSGAVRGLLVSLVQRALDVA
jgi:Protein of unknown function (DUF4244)